MDLFRLPRRIGLAIPSSPDDLLRLWESCKYPLQPKLSVVDFVCLLVITRMSLLSNPGVCSIHPDNYSSCWSVTKATPESITALCNRSYSRSIVDPSGFGIMYSIPMSIILLLYTSIDNFRYGFLWPVPRQFAHYSNASFIASGDLSRTSNSPRKNERNPVHCLPDWDNRSARWQWYPVGLMQLLHRKFRDPGFAKREKQCISPLIFPFPYSAIFL